MTELRVYLGGEGPNELGSYSGHLAYQDEGKPGVIQTLLRRIQPAGWRIVGVTKWSRIRKYKAGEGARSEVRNVQALILDAQEANADVLAFTRDADGSEQRVADVRWAIAEHEDKAEKPDLIAGVAVPVLEAWLLALGGERQTEQFTKGGAQSRFEQKYHFGKSTEKVVAYVESADLGSIAQDAVELRRWLDRARAVLAASETPAP